MNDEKKIRIHALQCGSIRITPHMADSTRKGFGPRVELPVFVYLVEHPVHGSILIDTGLSADCRQSFPLHLRTMLEPQIAPGQTAAKQLTALGFRPEDIDLVLLTHLDPDHTGGLADFAGKAKRIVLPEYEYFFCCRTVFKLRQPWKYYIPYADLIERPYYYGTPASPQGKGFDLFGDDSVLCLYAQGHTDGQMMIMLNRGPSNRFTACGGGNYGGDYVVFAADSALTQHNIDALAVPGYGFNEMAQLQVLRWLKDRKADPKCRAVFCSHDPELKPGLFEL